MVCYWVGGGTPNIMPCLCTVQVVVAGYLFSILPRQFYVPLDTEPEPEPESEAVAVAANASYTQFLVRSTIIYLSVSLLI